MIQIDMPMPSNCMDCRFNATGCAAMGRRFDNPLVYPNEDDRGYDLLYEQRMPWCPLKAENDMPCFNCPMQPIRPTYRDNKVYCGQCGKRIPLKIKANYCHKCGREINWLP